MIISQVREHRGGWGALPLHGGEMQQWREAWIWTFCNFLDHSTRPCGVRQGAFALLK